jgi:hypothetical protein
VLQIRSNQQLRATLAESLVSQAQMMANNGEQGGRDAALSLLHEADDLKAPASDHLKAARRSALARALAMPQLTPVDTWPVPSRSNVGLEGFSSDLRRYLAATPDGGFALFEVDSRKIIRAFPPPEAEREARRLAPAIRFQLSPDEKLAAVMCAGDSNVPAALHVVSLSDGRSLGVWSAVYSSREWPIWLADGGFLFGNSMTPCLRSDAEGKNIRPFPDEASASALVPLARNPTGSRVIVAHRSSNALVCLNVADGRESWRTPLQEFPSVVAWSSDGALVAVGERAPATLPGGPTGFGILLFDPESGAFREELEGHPFEVVQLCFLHGSRSVLSGGWDGKLVWQETRSGGFRMTTQAEGARVLQPDMKGTRLAWSPAQGSLCIGEARLPSGWQLWDEKANDTTCAQATKDGQRLYVSTRGDLQIWDTRRGVRLNRKPWAKGFTKDWPWLGVRPDGREVVVGDSGQPLHSIAISDAPDGSDRSVIEPPLPRGPKGQRYMIHRFGPGGEWVVCTSNGGRSIQSGRTYALWPAGDHTRAHVVTRDSSASALILAGPGGQWALGASRNGVDCGVWETATGKSLGTLGIADSLVLQSSPDFLTVAFVSRSKTGLWDGRTGKIRTVWDSPPGVSGSQPAFSPDGRLLLTNDKVGHLYIDEVPSGRRVVSLKVPGSDSLRAVEWIGPQQIVVIDQNGRIGAWDLAETARAAAALGLPW